MVRYKEQPRRVLKDAGFKDQQKTNITMKKQLFFLLSLAEIQEIEAEIIQLGYQIVAVSPDSPENLQQTDEKQKLNYSLYSDADGTFIKGIGIDFKAPERMSGMLTDISGGKNDGLLPVPSVFVVDTTGKIMFEYINPDFRTRLTAGLLIAVLRELQPDGS